MRVKDANRVYQRAKEELEKSGNLKGSIKETVVEEEQIMEIRFRRRCRNPHVNHIVMRVAPKLWQRVTAEGSVHIDLKRSTVEDFSPVIQCTRCLGFGHGRRNCKEANSLCSHCGGPHLRHDCPHYIVGEQPCCLNCRSAGLEKTDHGALSASVRSGESGTP
ncbi:uncharacterized protein LOC126970360 [Leptidea sinapis]|uniref:uncharacterized protein LOC126970360 n=1 Tax=Leptidea sinapis TaxID=189913 RepID=UPI0021C3FE25|nr:uncharacterized protein LOC126970360 [Leptidea sinapis]